MLFFAGVSLLFVFAVLVRVEETAKLLNTLLEICEVYERRIARPGATPRKFHLCNLYLGLTLRVNSVFITACGLVCFWSPNLNFFNPLFPSLIHSCHSFFTCTLIRIAVGLLQFAMVVQFMGMMYCTAAFVYPFLFFLQEIFKRLR